VKKTSEPPKQRRSGGDRDKYRELLTHLRPYLGRFWLAVGLAVLFSLLNSSIPLIIKFVAEAVFPDGFNRSMVRAAAVQGSGSQLGDALWVCMLVPAIMIARGITAYLNAYQMSWITLRVLNDIRSELFDRLITLDMGFFDKARTGQLMSRVMNNTKVMQRSLSHLSVDLFKQPIALLGGIAVLFYLDWRFSLVALLLFPLCVVPVIYLGRKVRAAGLAEENLAGRMNIILQETFSGIRVVKSFAAESYVNAQFLAASDWQFQKGLRVKRSLQLTTPIVEITAAFGVSLALVFVYWTGMSAATFLALMAGIFLLYQPAKALSQIHVMLQKCLTAMTHVFELMHREPAVQDRPDAVSIRGSRGALGFDGVSFSYGPEVAALQDIRLQIEPGQRVALVGSSGAGKSTLLSLILRFYDPQEGAVLLDGRDLRNITMDSLRNQIGIVTQDTFLFHDTIYNNILFGRLDASRDEVEAAARQAFAHDFILGQPEGYETIVGDKGCRLSGGQQQRLSIARALLKNAPILLLDEATSALDSESERMIQDALERLAKGKTVVAIAHRLSTVIHSDVIIVMDGGQIVDTGKHEDLLEKSPTYRKLYHLQFGTRATVGAVA